MIIGYVRVSTAEQHLDLQHDALRKAGCERIFEDQMSGVSSDRPGWNQARGALRAGDTLVVWRLDRVGRSLKHLVEVITDLEENGVAFKSLTENLDTSSSGGKLVFHIFGALAEFKRELIRERTLASLAAARARGRKGGRPRKLDTRKVGTTRRTLEDPNQTVTEVAEVLGVARSTLYRDLKAPRGRLVGWPHRRTDRRTGEQGGQNATGLSGSVHDRPQHAGKIGASIRTPSTKTRGGGYRELDVRPPPARGTS